MTATLARLQHWLNARWYTSEAPPLLLRPLAGLYGSIADARARNHQRQAAKLQLPVPVIVVGNITTGGAGKTPVTLALLALAQAQGLRVGVVSRGYGGRERGPRIVDVAATAAEVGDEPLLIARRAGVPVCVGRDRVAAVRHLCGIAELDLVLSDDGLQHYRLPRAAEIAVVDGARGFGNGWRLPAGPLREPPQRLAGCDLIIINGGAAASSFGLSEPPPHVHATLELSQAVRLIDGAVQPLSSLVGQPLRAVAGIGHPQRFFDALRGAGLAITPLALADHAAVPAALLRDETLPLLLTEKDAVKLDAPVGRHIYMVPASLKWATGGSEAASALLLRVVGNRAGHHSDGET